MRIGIPVEEGRLCQHFGQAPQIAFVDVDDATRTIAGVRMVQAPPHEHGVLPRLMASEGVTLVIAGGIGGGARTLLAQMGIALLGGASSESPEALVAACLDGTLVTGDGACNHHGEHHGHGHGH